MKANLQAARPPEKPTLIFDGDCNFCRRWILTWQSATGDKVDYFPAQEPEIARRYPEISPEACQTSVQLIAKDGQVYVQAEAVFRALAESPGRRWLLDLYQSFPLFAGASDRVYRFVASHRMFFSFLTRWLLPATPLRYELTRSLFLRALGLIYLAAFFSLGTQILGLSGLRGIVPASQFMDQAGLQLRGLDRFLEVPTLCWLSSSDGFLQGQCWAGSFLAVLLVAGLAPGPILFVLWLLWLSLATVCEPFLGFQWENLLLETGFLALFLAPWSLSLRRGGKPSLLFIWLLRWLLFRLMFESGLVKLLSGDPTWSGLTALKFHFETQPLPTWVGWHAHQLAGSVQKLSTAAVFFIELAVGFLILFPRRLRLYSFLPLVGLQLAIALTGNYCYFNFLTMALCLAVLDDQAISRFWPTRWRKVAAINANPSPPGRKPSVLWLRVPVVAAVFCLSLFQLLAMSRRAPPLLSVFAGLFQFAQPFRSVNSYGLFAVMTTTRPEIILEGSADGQTWRPYEFKYKPGDLRRRPAFVAPHQPRLDWQMWFAALGTIRQNPWLINLCVRLLQDSNPVLNLLETNPFPDRPPKWIRASLYTYHFSDPKTRRETGQWWAREPDGLYCPAFSLEMVQSNVP